MYKELNYHPLHNHEVRESTVKKKRSERCTELKVLTSSHLLYFEGPVS